MPTNEERIEQGNRALAKFMSQIEGLGMPADCLEVAKQSFKCGYAACADNFQEEIGRVEVLNMETLEDVKNVSALLGELERQLPVLSIN